MWSRFEHYVYVDLCNKGAPPIFSIRRRRQNASLVPRLSLSAHKFNVRPLNPNGGGRAWYILYVKLRQGRHVFTRVDTFFRGQRFTTHACSRIWLVLHALMGSGIRQEKDEGGFFRLLAPVHTTKPTVTHGSQSFQLTNLAGFRTRGHGRLGRMYGCAIDKSLPHVDLPP